MGLTDFRTTQLLPALRRCGLTVDEVVAGQKVQEVVYLLQQAGVPLGFRYKWEVFGPFSTSLADEIDDLERESIEGVFRADEEVVAEIEAVQSLLNPPETLDLSGDEWLRLLVCVDFVERRVPGITENGQTPAYIDLNFQKTEVACAREAARAFSGTS